MTVTLAQLKNSESTLNKLFNAPLPVRVSYQLTKVIKIISEEMKQFEIARYGLVEKYGKSIDDNTISVTPENQAKFMEEINSLLSIPITLPDFTLTLNDLSEAKLSTVDLARLEFWISE